MDTSKTNDIQPLDGCKQRHMVLTLLQAGPVTSLELRAHGVLTPSARILELKQRGYKITVKLLPIVVGPTGITHKRIAQYRLEPPSE
jgi:hypothetical protein